jgi:S-adenosyl methyltransferase
MLTAKNDGTAVVHADLRDTDEVLSGAGKLLDFTRPTGLLFVGCLHHIPDPDDPASIVARYLAALAPGSYLVISHATNEFSAEKMSANAEVADNSGTMLIPRSRDAIMGMFN